MKSSGLFILTIYLLTFYSCRTDEKRQAPATQNIPTPIENIDNDKYYVVEIAVGYNFDSLYAIAVEAADLLHSRVDMLGRVYNPQKGVIVPDDSDEEDLRGSHFPRWPEDDQNFVSIEEYRDYEKGIGDWKNNDTLLLRVVANIFDNQPAADSVINLVANKIKTARTIERHIHFQCGL